ncbi:cytochrome c5 family protein [Pseudomaricurvus alkylphenolicus]|jgi:cytochrome c5|uniref:c-type cytochrome n=1 Tax=Pseudomaricurvus alkylphenolicus TaxID=1306991 RepID=UPI0014211C51|nr:c-type cytochrome [Pseudomaricurvus alkylphenolicus]NIB42559.1 cytochrome c5 family protein [Pseudomaricurvus alkylphenolicus]
MNIKNQVSSIALIWGMAFAISAQVPEDAYIAELYEDSCMACHASEHSGAPLAGDKAAWTPRLKQGMEQLLNNTIDGIRGMPALGSCADCTAEDFEALIAFMAGIGSQTNKSH